MTKPSDNPADPFKKALAEATKVMANDPELTVSYSVDPAGQTADTMRLPQVTRRMTREEVLLARGTADAFALRHKYHDAKTAARYMPQGQMAKDLYEAMESARVEAIGARHMPGTASNIDAKIGDEARRKGYDQITNASDAPLAVAAGYLIRHLATGRPLPKGAENVMELWRGFIEDHAGNTLTNLSDMIADQQAFAKFARQMIADLGYADQLGDDPDTSDEDQDDAAQDGADEEEQPDSNGNDESEGEEAEASPEETQEDQQDQSEAQVSMDDQADAEMGDESDVNEGEAPLEPPA
ncbi:MAG: cobaltochelatase subunit CobT, partial [Yoonia sp.]|nr:cobaltochelatase subunit CobT [Yoonia sp.]